MFIVNERKNNIVKIVDSMMGTFKTTNILKWMDANPDKRYIYVSPLLTEVDKGGRVHRSLKNINLEIPSYEDGTKSDSFLEMLRAGDSIACTHSLYLSMTEKHFDVLSKSDYTVIIDEEVNVIDGFDKYSKNDLKWLLDKEDIRISDHDGMVSWIGDRERIKSGHKYRNFLQYCDSKSLYSTKRSETMMCTHLPIRLFDCAKEVIILTYMFEGNILDCFLKLKGFEVEKFKDIKCIDVGKVKISDLLTVVPPNKKLTQHSLSSTWFAEANGKDLSEVSNYIRNTCKVYGMTKDDVVWTVPKFRAVKIGNNNKNLIRPIGFSQDSKKETNWLAAQTRATNDFYDKKIMIHCYNRRPLVAVSSYLQDYGYPVDLKVFATSEILQWAFRGCIRDSKPMVLAIGSKRMYDYFCDWLGSPL
jgi:hypothetical protein